MRHLWIERWERVNGWIWRAALRRRTTHPRAEAVVHVGDGRSPRRSDAGQPVFVVVAIARRIRASDHRRSPAVVVIAKCGRAGFRESSARVGVVLGVAVARLRRSTSAGVVGVRGRVTRSRLVEQRVPARRLPSELLAQLPGESNPRSRTADHGAAVQMP